MPLRRKKRENPQSLASALKNPSPAQLNCYVGRLVNDIDH